MNKAILLVALFCSSILYASSQVSFNAKAGTNISKVTGADADMKLGYQFSVGADYYFTNEWGVQSALVLVSKGAKLPYKDVQYLSPEGDLIDFKQKYSINEVYLELPVMLAYKMTMTDDIKFVFNGGGYVACGIAGKTTNKNKMSDGKILKDKDDTFGDGIRRFDVGLGAGFTIELSNRYTVGLTGSWGLRSISDSGNSFKNQSYGLNVGYKF